MPSITKYPPQINEYFRNQILIEVNTEAQLFHYNLKENYFNIVNVSSNF